jgi:glycosyltransferase involved in cell wall biosynthesis
MIMPRVSVCIPTYNSARHLPEAVESVLRQEFEDYELIIVDNASSDETPEICSSYDDPRLRYVRYEKLVGQGGNWNRCLSQATGEYVALLHADDRYLPRFLTERVETLDQNPSVGLAFGAVTVIDEAGAEIGRKAFREEASFWPSPHFYKELLLGCVVSPVSPVVRRYCYETIGGFREDRKWGIDCEMWLRIAAKFAVSYSPVTLAGYRIHAASGTTDALATADNGPEDLLLLLDSFHEIAIRPELAQFAPLRRSALRALSLRMLCFAGYACERGNRSATRKHLHLALRVDPSLLSRPTSWALGASCLLGPTIYRGFRAIRGG